MRLITQRLKKLRMISVALLVTAMIAVASPAAWAQIILDPILTGTVTEILHIAKVYATGHAAATLFYVTAPD